MIVLDTLRAQGPYSPILNPTVFGDQIIECLRVENSRVVERALFLFKDERFLDMMATNKHKTFVPLLSALLRGGEPFWNPTVNKVSKTANKMPHLLESI